MTYRDDDLSDPLGDCAAAALRRIAEALGSSTESFFRQPTLTGDTEATQELLRLWDELPHPQARQRVLTRLRFEVEQSRLHREAI